MTKSDEDALKELSADVRDLREHVVALRVREEELLRTMQKFFRHVELLESRQNEMYVQLAVMQEKSGAKAGAVAGGSFGAVTGVLSDILYRIFS